MNNLMNNFECLMKNIINFLTFFKWLGKIGICSLSSKKLVTHRGSSTGMVSESEYNCKISIGPTCTDIIPWKNGH